MNTHQNVLHVHYIFRNQQAFQKVLGNSRSNYGTQNTMSSSGGRSWTRPSPLSNAPVVDVNARDSFGRTVLHLACSSVDAGALEYVRMLLAHPGINVNIQDMESHWSALHRAMYVGNLPACILLLQRDDIDISLKDYEGYTAFDLYNSTVNGTKPEPTFDTAELFTWGTNRNATLGHGDAEDRSNPDQVLLKTEDDPAKPIKERFTPITFSDITMAKLHTIVLTSESRANVRVCGFGSGGRLGIMQNTQYSLLPISGLSHKISKIAAGQDHSLALSSNGDVLSWGLNRFSQLGYVLEIPKGEEPIQSVPRKVHGLLKKEIVLGIAAAKTASACWTADALFTWGTNGGQLGYDKNAQPVQILPRVVSAVTLRVLDVALSDSAMTCLLESREVICFYNDIHTRIVFPVHSFPAEFSVYRPPQAINKAMMTKVTTCDEVFACLSSMGDLYTFTPPSPNEMDGSKGRDRATAGIKPQRVWALRKQFSAVKDVALGSDGSIILCTESGHVFVRSRNAKGTGGKAFKFQRIPFVQRVVRVSANSAGAFAALRVVKQAQRLDSTPATVGQDLGRIRPWFTLQDEASSPTDRGLPPTPELAEGAEDDEGDNTVVALQIREVRRLIKVLAQSKVSKNYSLEHRLGSNLLVKAGPMSIPVHRTILTSRSLILSEILSGQSSRDSSITLTKLGLHINHSPFSVLCLLTFIYTDMVLTIWDPRILRRLAGELASVGVKAVLVKAELQQLANLLQLPSLEGALAGTSVKPITPSLKIDQSALFQTCLAQPGLSSHISQPDIEIQFCDRSALFHSAILRARSPFFASFFDEEAWTKLRRESNNIIRVSLRHRKWRAASLVFDHMYTGNEHSLFHVLDFVASREDAIDFVFEVLDIANELLLEHFVLVCSNVILQFVELWNVCSLLADASHFRVVPLQNRLHEFIAANMETMLENRLLDDMPLDLLRELASAIRLHQSTKSPFTRTDRFVQDLLVKWADFLASEDIPQPIVPSTRALNRASPKISPVSPTGGGPLKFSAVQKCRSPSSSPQQNAAEQNSTDIFTMDEENLSDIPPLSLPPVEQTPPPVWKASSHRDANS
ncbi:RCC1/BLIP-II protein [Sistotremastrum niveocremeum HHB9708]|uniref:RCC1/BLIP-II protein n=1 Tax=Sistotremastrum niveocremeum HHB9708 TaxID=1314777 RepID=A0A164UIC6_9AGAM|nr:RCC1/BLIP-II protein [Sistotremastrum niveocremeum HHB9708]